jgi:hypothetical protein
MSEHVTDLMTTVETVLDMDPDTRIDEAAFSADLESDPHGCYLDWMFAVIEVAAEHGIGPAIAQRYHKNRSDTHARRQQLAKCLEDTVRNE